MSFLTPAEALVFVEVHLGTDDFVTIQNNTPSGISLAGYTLRIRNSAQAAIDFALPGGTLESGEDISVSDSPTPGFDIDVAQNLLWSASSDLSLALIDPGQVVLDFVAIGSTVIDPPPGITFSPGAVDPSGIDEQSQSLIRTSAVGSSPNFFQIDWSIGSKSGPANGNLTYTIGGSASGLVGSGLVLQNNAGDDLPVSVNGSFTFDARLPDGSAYGVTILTQPADPSQTCSVTNGSGTLMGANITNVAVDCSTNTFTIGGTVSGLTGSGLVLQKNAGDDLPVSANGSFTFATALADGSAYAVTVLTQPADPGQTCSVGNGSGTLAGANVTDVAIQCTTNSFTVGGTVGGLAGSGLVLQNNAGDDLPISAEGNFTFATALADGSAYAVTVLSQPTDPNQTCSAGNGSGMLMGADVTGVAVDCVTDSADLEVTKSDAQDTLVAGDPITYMITVTNNGPQDVVGALVQDTLPVELSLATWQCLPSTGASCTASGSGDLGDSVDIPAGESVNYTLTAATDPDFRGPISNTVTVAVPANITDPDPANNSATDISATDALFTDGFEEPLAALKTWLKEKPQR